MATDAMLDTLRRSVAARNSDPQKKRRWLDDFSDRTEGENYDRDQMASGE